MGFVLIIAAISMGNKKLTQIKCGGCGRFISYKDFNSGWCKQKEIWQYVPSPELYEVITYCIKCSEDLK